MKILILYFSGAGSTRFVAEEMHRVLGAAGGAELCSFEEAEGLELERYGAFVFGTPVYHAAPARLVLDFAARLAPRVRPAPVFLYNTRALWSCNTNRILAKRLLVKGYFTVMDRDYRSPASDGSLIVPFVERFFEFDRRIREKIGRDCAVFRAMLERGHGRRYLPRPRFSSVLNAPNKLAGQLVTFPIYLHRERCTRCGLCRRACPCGAWESDGLGYPLFVRGRCENCYRCIHHCPGKALSLSRRRPPGRQLEFPADGGGKRLTDCGMLWVRAVRGLRG